MKKVTSPTKKKPETAIVQAEIVPDDGGRVAPPQRRLDPKEVIASSFSEAQMRILINQTPAWAIKKREGGNGRMLSYVPHGYVTDQLNKAFGFNWDLIIDPIENGKMFTLVYEDIFDKNGNKIKVDRHVAVAGHLVVRSIMKNGEVCEIVKHGFGSQKWLPTMEFGDALKAARSDMVKTCATQYGIALDLYFNERAEFEEFEKREQERSASEQLAAKLVSQVPVNPVILISRSMSDYKIDANAVCKILELDMVQLMKLTPEQVAEAWAKVEQYAKT